MGVYLWDVIHLDRVHCNASHRETRNMNVRSQAHLDYDVGGKE